MKEFSKEEKLKTLLRLLNPLTEQFCVMEKSLAFLVSQQKKRQNLSMVTQQISQSMKLASIFSWSALASPLRILRDFKVGTMWHKSVSQNIGKLLVVKVLTH